MRKTRIIQQKHSKMIWVSSRPVFDDKGKHIGFKAVQGTYVRAKHGPIGTEKEKAHDTKQGNSTVQAEA